MLCSSVHNERVETVLSLPASYIRYIRTFTTALPRSPNTCSSVLLLSDPTPFTAEQVLSASVPCSGVEEGQRLSCVVLSTWTVLPVVNLGGAAWTSAPLWSQVMLEGG